MTFISKSKFMDGLQCSKLLWYQYNAKDQIPSLDPETEARMEQGHLVGDWAKKAFPGGIEIDWTADYDRVVADTKKLLSKRKPLFEAAFQNGSAYSRMDVLNPVGRDEWDIIEVKSATEVKKEYYDDVAFQKFCCNVKIRKCFIMHINKEYIRNGAIEPDKLFTTIEITSEVNERIKTVEKELQDMLKLIELKKCPKISIGPQCGKPNECILKPLCWKFLPEHNVCQLYYMGKKAFAFIDSGMIAIKDIPENHPLTEQQEIQRQCVLKGHHHINPKAIKSFLDNLHYPLYFLDFETINPPIPPFDGTWPYQQIPFQFSLHVLKTPDGKPELHSFLADGPEDFRLALLKELKRHIGPKGDVLAYYVTFEQGRLAELADMYPDYEPWLQELMARLVDLFAPFKAFDYYHPSQKGSASIKSVMPALTDLSYDEMEISDGGIASREFMRINFNKVAPEDKNKVRKQLLEYCTQDTGGMVCIVEELRKLVENGPKH